MRMPGQTGGKQAEGDPVITVRVPEELNDEIDEVWRDRGYASRSEFIRDALRSATNPQITVSDEFMEHLRASQRQREDGEGIALEDLD